MWKSIWIIRVMGEWTVGKDNKKHILLKISKPHIFIAKHCYTVINIATVPYNYHNALIKYDTFSYEYVSYRIIVENAWIATASRCKVNTKFMNIL